MPATDAKQQFLEFLNKHIFQLVADIDPLTFSADGDRKLFKSVQKRVHETRVRYFADYATAGEVKVNFVQDLNSKSGQLLASDMWFLKLKRFEDIRPEFHALCKKLGL